MNITDELRKWCENRAFLGNGWQELHAIADHIDAEHERRCREQYACGAEDGISVSIDALVIQTHGFIELPKDADGEYIRIGDKVTLYGRCVYEVDGIHFYKNNVSLSYKGESGCGSDSASNFRHYHAPTVEDVLREFVHEFIDYATCIDDHEVTDAIEQYAKRLKLAEGEDE